VTLVPTKLSRIEAAKSLDFVTGSMMIFEECCNVANEIHVGRSWKEGYV
jgi:hypothetical protein